MMIKREGIKIATYVVTGATLQCNCGDEQSAFQAAADRTVFINGKAQGTIQDFAPNKNIMSFGKCQTMSNPTVAAATAANQGQLKPMPCVPVIMSPWQSGKTDELIQGAAALMEHSFSLCQWGGRITVQKDGQDSKFATDGAVGAKTQTTPMKNKNESSAIEDEDNGYSKYYSEDLPEYVIDSKILTGDKTMRERRLNGRTTATVIKAIIVHYVGRVKNFV